MDDRGGHARSHACLTGPRHWCRNRPLTDAPGEPVNDEETGETSDVGGRECDRLARHRAGRGSRAVGPEFLRAVGGVASHVASCSRTQGSIRWHSIRAAAVQAMPPEDSCTPADLLFYPRT